MSLANFDPREGTLSSATTITFNWIAMKISITNDSSYELQFKLNSSETFATLKPTETISMVARSKTVFLDSPSSKSISYRVWAWG